MYDKQYVHDQVIVCRDKFEEIMESAEKGEDIEQLLINLDEHYTVLYDRWILFFTNYEPREPDGDTDQVQAS